jgi:hypothetical protein
MQLLKSENKKTNILPMFAIGTLGVNVRVDVAAIKSADCIAKFDPAN